MDAPRRFASQRSDRAARNDDGGGRIARSMDATDRDKCGVPKAIATLTTSDFHSLAFDPRDPDIVCFGHHYGMLKSIDGGVNWSPVLQQGDATLAWLCELQHSHVPARARVSLVALDNSWVMAGPEVFMRGDNGGALYSAWLFWRKRVLPNRKVDNILIAAGAMAPAFGGALNRFGLPGHYIGEFIGGCLMYVGFLQATAAE